MRASPLRRIVAQLLDALVTLLLSPFVVFAYFRYSYARGRTFAQSLLGVTMVPSDETRAFGWALRRAFTVLFAQFMLLAALVALLLSTD